MTPERLELKQWVEKRLYDHYASQPDCDCMYCDWRRDYLLAVAEVETLHEQAKQGTLEAARQIDALTAENTTLKGEVERLQMIALCGDKSHLLVIRERDTLRTRLDALVTAGTLAARALENIVDKKVGEWDDWETAMRESYPEYLRDIRGQAKQGLDALAAAVREAKGEK